jgi:hypothetical protein
MNELDTQRRMYLITFFVLNPIFNTKAKRYHPPKPPPSSPSAP